LYRKEGEGKAATNAFKEREKKRKGKNGILNAIHMHLSLPCSKRKKKKKGV